MKNREFVSSEHANQYLSGTIIRLAGEPIFVKDVARSIITYSKSYEYHLDYKYKKIKLDSPELDMTAFNIGFVNNFSALNTKIKAVRVFRTAYRGSRVGLCSQNFYSPDSVDPSIMFTYNFYSSVMNKFPSLSQAITQLNKNNKVAFDKKFAINKQALFYLYEDAPVGTFDGKEFMLDPSFEYLKEDLERAIG